MLSTDREDAECFRARAARFVVQWRQGLRPLSLSLCRRSSKKSLSASIDESIRACVCACLRLSLSSVVSVLVCVRVHVGERVCGSGMGRGGEVRMFVCLEETQRQRAKRRNREEGK